MEAVPIDYLPKLILTKPIRKYTLEEFLQKEVQSKIKHEFINGQIIKVPMARGPHNIISVNISHEIIVETEKKEENVIVFNSDQMVYFPSLDEGIYADSLAVCEKPLYWDDNNLLLINPILVVEVLSKSTQKYDRSGKYDKYKTLKSFKEYVLIHQDECYAEVRYQFKPGFWQETIVKNIYGKLPLQSLGIEIEMKRIYKNIELKEVNPK
jgi:Uma2 family endonuclease